MTQTPEERSTLKAIEDAIVAHLEAVRKANDGEGEGVVIDWVLGVTLSKIDDDNDVAYRNLSIGPNNNPNGQSALAAWVSTEIMDELAWDSEDDA